MKKIAFTFSLLLLLISENFAQTILSIQEIEDLKCLYEEERLANDVYKKLAKKWNSRIFSRIAKSEKRHYIYLLDRLEKHHIAIPKNEVGFYNCGELNNMYDNFLRVGFQSYDKALQVAAQFEEHDIVNLQEALALTDENDLQQVYQYLMSGAKHHLAALYRNIKRRNKRYEPILLKKAVFDEIINRTKVEKKEKNVPITLVLRFRTFNHSKLLKRSTSTDDDI